MKTLSILFYAAIIFVSLSVHAQTKTHKKTTDTILTQLEKRKAVIDQYIFKHQKNIIEFAKVMGKKNLMRVKNDNWPDQTEYSYNIIKDTSGRILMIAQIPYSQSGDWYEEFKHYFDDKGNTFAFTIRITVFDDSVKDGVAMWQSFNYYMPALNLIKHTTTLTDSKEKSLKGRKTEEFDFRHDPYHIYKSVEDCLKAYQINKSAL